MSSSAKEEFMPANNRKNPFLLAPASAFAVLVLLLVFGFLERDGGVMASVTVMVLTLIAFGLPLLAIPRLRNVRSRDLFPFRIPKRRELLLSIACLFLLIFLTAMIKYVIFGMEYDYREVSLYGFTLSFPKTMGTWVIAVFSVAVIPAVMEELLLRGALFYEYRNAGAAVSVWMTSLLAGMMGLSFESFPMLLVSALVFALARFLTGNLAVSMLVHILYGVYTISFEKYMWLMSSSDESRVLFSFLTGIFLGLSLIWVLGLAEKILRGRASVGEDAPVSPSLRKRILNVLNIFTAAPLWMLLCVYIIIAVVKLFI